MEKTRALHSRRTDFIAVKGLARGSDPIILCYEALLCKVCLPGIWSTNSAAHLQATNIIIGCQVGLPQDTQERESSDYCSLLPDVLVWGSTRSINMNEPQRPYHSNRYVIRP